LTGLENILNGIKSDSEKIAADLIKEAEKKASDVIAEAKAEAEKILSAEEEKSKLLAENILNRAKSSAEVNAKRIYLSKKQELIEEVIKAAKEKLNALDGDEYLKVLKDIITKNVSNTDGEIVLSKSDLEKVSGELGEFLKEKRLNISERVLPENKKGCILVYSNVEENCTFDELFDAYSESVSDKVQEFLFD